MRIFSWDDILHNDLSRYFEKESAITIGSFDGPHKGHAALFSEVLSEAEKRGIFSGIITFKRALPGLKMPENYAGDIATLNQRLKEYEKRGFDFAVAVDFNESFAATSGEEFFNILLEKCGLKFLCEGPDFKCGYKGRFGKKEITEYAFKKGFDVRFPLLVQEHSERVSSSGIRKLIQKGAFSEAEKLLERPFELELGKSITDGFSVLIERKSVIQVLPEEGVYKVRTDKGETAVLEIHSDFLFLTGFEKAPVKRITFFNID